MEPQPEKLELYAYENSSPGVVEFDSSVQPVGRGTGFKECSCRALPEDFHCSEAADTWKWLGTTDVAPLAEYDNILIRHYSGTNIELMIRVPNDALQSLNDQNAANTWVRDNIQSYSNVRFQYIAVGNEVDPNNGNSQYVSFVLPAMRNILTAVRNAGLGNQIKVSTATYTGLLGDSFPPSDGAFRDNVRGFIEPIIQFLTQNNQPMLANIYPYFSDPGSNLPYALFTASQPVVGDDGNGLQYSNLFDAILDAHYAAQVRLGGPNVEIVVSESGWASSGGTNGTPLKPGRSIETYLFAMFDENNKPANEEERHFGLFTPNQQPM
ncbi:hypothetical protein M8C21_018150, partial [Ambrosia artemisiifolia]